VNFEWTDSERSSFENGRIVFLGYPTISWDFMGFNGICFVIILG
jgi:hypothetical protein